MKPTEIKQYLTENGWLGEERWREPVYILITNLFVALPHLVHVSCEPDEARNWCSHNFGEHARLNGGETPDDGLWFDLGGEFFFFRSELDAAKFKLFFG